LYFVSIPVGSQASAPKSGASAAEVLQFVTDHRGGLLVSLVLNGIAWCALMPIVFAGLRELLGHNGGLAARVSFACAMVTAAMVGLLLVLYAMAAYAAPDISAETAKLLVDGGNIATSASAWPSVPCAAAMAVALRRTRALPSITVVLAWVSVAAECVSAISMARAGALSPTGIAMLAPAVFAVWMLTIAAATVRGRAVSPSMAPIGG
jgi:hypothetical protein